jgi:hypothetical protein
MGAFIDLTNEQYGMLTVLERAANTSSGRTAWLCQCECGQKKIIRSNDLRSGKVVSCGCYGKQKRQEALKNKNSTSSRRANLIGKVFERLTVIEYDEELSQQRAEPGHKAAYWKCQCSCGNIISVRTADLNSGHTKSCGCLSKEQASKNMKNIVQPLGAESRLIDLTGQKFGKLTVIKRVESDKLKPVWECLCECGNIKNIDGNALRQGTTKSCGCLGKSEGEALISQILSDNNIPYLKEVKFQDLKDKGLLRFDFAILNGKNEIIKLIEYDGRQHTDTTSNWYSEDILRRDKIKTNYALEKGIPLLRINYTDKNKITLDYLLNN